MVKVATAVPGTAAIPGAATTVPRTTAANARSGRKTLNRRGATHAEAAATSAHVEATAAATTVEAATSATTVEAATATAPATTAKGETRGRGRQCQNQG
jgi:predicted RNA-binding Zn ribbon-like protein